MNNTNYYSSSSCELYMIARDIISTRISYKRANVTRPFKVAFASATIFEHIHFQEYMLTSRTLTMKVEELCDYIETDEVFNDFIQYLHSSSTERAVINHIGFKAYETHNYTQCVKMVERFLSQIGEVRYKTFNPPQLKSFHNRLMQETAFLDVIRKIETMDLSPRAFKLQTSFRLFVSTELDEARVKTVSIYFAESAIERYLIELFRGTSTRIIFVPHGIPPISSFSTDFNYVLASTMDPIWHAAFPKSQIVHIGWTELFDKAPPRSPTKTSKRNKIQFLSQLSGEKIHRLSDFRKVFEFFITQARQLPKELYEVDIRLRHENECSMIDSSLRSWIDSNDSINFSFMDHNQLITSDADLLVSSTSTGLLYSQYLRIPSVQMVTPKLLQHWPFRLTYEENLFVMGDDNRQLKTVLERACDKGTFKMLYSEKTLNLKRGLFERIYAY